MSPHPFAGPSPSPVGSTNRPSPRHQENVVQPPALTTSLSGPQYQGLGVALGGGYVSTPLSTTSLSSPFSQSQSPYLPSPGGAVRGSSPMASRLSSNHTAPYNPQEWGPVGGASSNVGPAMYPQSNNNNGVRSPQPPPPASDIVPSPPPPYSPPGQRQPLRDSDVQAFSSAGSASPATVPSQYNTPTSSATTPEAPAGYRYAPPQSCPLSMAQLSDVELCLQQLSFPPPPGGPSSRSSSRNGSTKPHGLFNFPSLGIGRSRKSTKAPRTNVPQSTSSESHPQPLSVPLRPPSSKRAASTGAINTSGSSSRATGASPSPSPPRRSWEPGMPLPPPPPGPPPSTRSLSVSGSLESSSRRTVHPTSKPGNRPAPAPGTGLEPVPRTPADWVDEVSPQPDHNGPLRSSTGRSLSRSSNGFNETNTQGSGESASAPQKSPSSGLFRSPAVRDTNVKGIRERRLENRQKRHPGPEDFSATSPSTNPWVQAVEQMKLSDLVLPGSSGGRDYLDRQTLTTKSLPLSARSAMSDDQQNRSRTSSGLFSTRSSFSTPKPEPSPTTFRRDGYAQTPPFSPNTDLYSPTSAKDVPHAVPPKALPTPPPQSAHDFKPATPSGVADRPISHILHVPNDPVPMPPPLSPRGVSTTQQTSTVDSAIKRDTEFVCEAVKRHQEFIEKEAAAGSESEALRLFADFIISESSIRRGRYANAWNSNSLDVQDVRQRLFEPPKEPFPLPENSQDTLSASRRQPSGGQPTIEIPQSRPETAWWNSYQPCLSPIASISISNDEMSSRGRAPSRWWESKSSSEGVEGRVQRSKRESKYMGLPRELREAMQWGHGQVLQEAEEEGYPVSQPNAYGPNEYPPEKVGWHEQPSEPPPSNNASQGGFNPYSKAHKLDISRLVTLPPPFPRHHPAVNNSHPDLVSYRTTVRSISDLSEVKGTRQRHRIQLENMQQEHQRKIQEGRRQFRSNIQSQIQQGSITFAEAAEAEAALALEEKRLEEYLVQAEFDSYQEVVLQPLHAILTDRINRATACIDELSSKLFDAAQYETPDQAQEEGDEKPELLEKLTQLKWLFEAREQLHLEIYDLLSERDEKYRAVVSLPYRQSNNEEKIRETDAFFTRDALDRRVQYEAGTLARLESFMDVIEEHVVRGVEIHLSVFWDIAPSLLDLLQKIPEDLRGFEIQIPANEYEENPSYHRHPLQYLYSLLSHAEKSTYQYIESQTNLLCLLHEVKSAVTAATCKLMEAQRIRQGEAEDVVRREMQESRAEKERALTADLKDKVSTVEGQWTEALGSTIEAVRERVKKWLMAEGGWEELEQLEVA
ncbi:hypothetical protein VTN02DRAFT_2348 [Thermoascus thermophilus]